MTLSYNPTAGRRVRASEILEMVNQINSLTAPGYTSYTPAWTSAGTAPTTGNATLTGWYRRPASSDLVAVEGSFTFGSTSAAGTSDWRFSLPVSAHASAVGLTIGAAYLLDSGTTERSAVARLLTATTISIISPTGPIGLGVPWTWATGDIVRWSVTYRPA